MRYAFRVVASLVIIVALLGCVNPGAVTGDQARKIEIGMSRQAVQEVAGKPENINVTEGQGYRKEQWVYQKVGVYEKLYVYFRGGEVTTIQR